MLRALVLFVDVALLYLSLYLTVWIRYGEVSAHLWQRHLLPFSIIFFIWILIFFINGLYDIRKTTNDFRFYGKLVQNLIISALLAVLFFYLVQGDFTTLRPQRVLIILLLIYAVLFILWRRVYFSLASSSRLGNSLAIIGVSPESLALAEEIITKPQLGYKLKLIINPDHSELDDKFHVVKVSRDIANLKDQLLESKIDTVVTVNNSKYGPEVAKHLFESIDLKIQYFNITDFYEKISGKILLSTLERNWFLENITNLNSQWLNFVKRLIDILFVLVFGTISLILVPFIIIAIKLESPGPVIFKQKRVGLRNKVFTVYKFRSMVKNAEKNGAVWAKENDARVTKLGKFMRKTRLDEIPQFINILRGTMSFVGPRPERPEFVEKLIEEIPFYNERHLVKPGLSGWAQINYPYGASVDDAKEKLQYDLFYIKNQSIALDISIILKTINAVLDKTLGR